MEMTRKETALRALRMIGVVASDEPPTADQEKSAKAVLESIWQEVLTEAQATWDISTGIPQEAFVPLSQFLAAELAPEYGVAAPMTRSRAKLRLLAVIRPDDRCCDHEIRHDYGMPPCR